PDPVTRMLDTSGTGAWTTVANSHVGYREAGSAAMYRPGKILIAGGRDAGKGVTATAEGIDLDAATPVWRDSGERTFPRYNMDTPLLPDGSVLVTGGTSTPDDAQGSAYAAELWDPSTERWRQLASMSVPRLYHSTAVLLPDGRVIVAGGGLPA